MALEETDRVIQAVRLMREYLEAEERSCAEAVAVGPAIGSVLELLSGVAEAHGVKLFTMGASNARIPMSNMKLQRMLFYLIESLIESVERYRAITVVLEDCRSQSFLSAYCLPIYAAPERPMVGSAPNAFRRARIAIAQRALECSGAVVCSQWGGKAGFTIRIPAE
ncbi:MAG TPA: hypothetical protein VL983_00745 [Terriglobales bacterium]|nr:hypothetical protein [Terriglobales bacterium]